ncbi:hypothetical protein D3C80_1546580 [compost metagenome]
MGEITFVLLQLLSCQEQHRAQRHPCGGHGRRDGYYADQVDAQADPVQRVIGAGSGQVDDVAQSVEQGDDVAHHRHRTGPGLDGGQVDVVAAEVQQPVVDDIFALAEVLRDQVVQGDEGDFALFDFFLFLWVHRFNSLPGRVM